jgi:pullulanase
MNKFLRFLALPLLALLGFSCQEKKIVSFDEYPVYPDANLWTRYTQEFTEFMLWSPPAEAVAINLYEKGEGGSPTEVKEMEETDEGLWYLKETGNIHGMYYTYTVKIDGRWLEETPGIYATAVGVNGKRAMVVDMEKTNPEGWSEDRGPDMEHPNQAIIYELHVRDITIHPSSGSSIPGKFTGLVEEGTSGPEGTKTGIDHMKELGITHVHLLPSFDYYSVDETTLEKNDFNWGYDPQNYNVPEGSYSTDPYRAEVRIGEFKKMVKGFHDNGIGVILDVVYNHTGGPNELSNFNLEVPGYYYRQNPDGSYANASACGNETASERAMMRKYMVESVLFWAREYHLDGFRFDLMGIHDIETMNLLAKKLKEYDPNILIYGEGWTAGDSPLPVNDRALKKHTYRMPNISAFSDDIRDGLKGSVFEDHEAGFVNGAENLEETVKFGIVGSIEHDQVDAQAVNYSDTAWAEQPWQAVSYVSCHDNHTLFDKLSISAESASPAEIRSMQMLANAIVLTSQGVPFLHAGVEMLRTKNGEHNSYNLPDSINQIDWNWKVQNKDVVDYYKKLIALRKNHPAFYMPNAEMVREHLRFFETQDGLVGFTISRNANGDKWSEIMVCFNANTTPRVVSLDKRWTIAAMGDEINESGLGSASGILTIPPVSMFLGYRK